MTKKERCPYCGKDLSLQCCVNGRDELLARADTMFPGLKFENMRPLCAGCGGEITDQNIIEPSLCTRCEEHIRQADTAWIKKEDQEQVR